MLDKEEEGRKVDNDCIHVCAVCISEEVRTPAAFAVSRPALLTDQCILACGLQQGHPMFVYQRSTGRESQWRDMHVNLN